MGKKYINAQTLTQKLFTRLLKPRKARHYTKIEFIIHAILFSILFLSILFFKIRKLFI